MSEHIEEIIKCKNSFLYFVSNYYHITNDYGSMLLIPTNKQIKLINNLKEDKHINLASIYDYKRTGKTTIFSAFMLYTAIFNIDQKMFILSETLEYSKSVLSDIKYAYELLPSFLKCNFKQTNKTSIKFLNDSTILALRIDENALRGHSPNLIYINGLYKLNEKRFERFYETLCPLQPEFIFIES